jgi:hypothetical protein
VLAGLSQPIPILKILVSIYLTQPIPIYSLVSAVLGQVIPKMFEIPDFLYHIDSIDQPD